MGLHLMEIIELHDLITKALADGKQVTYDYSEDESSICCKGWAHVDSATIDGNDLVLDIFSCHSAWSISLSSNDQSAINDFITRVAIYDELYNPRDVVLGAGKSRLGDAIDDAKR